VFAAILAAQGFTGAREIFAGRYGFFELYQPGGYDIARLTDGLGVSFRGDAISFKPYPCGRPLHAVLDAALALRAQLDLAANDIGEVVLELDPATYAEQFKGGEHKRRPEHVVHAQFGLPFLVAAALVHGRVGIDEVLRIDDAKVLALAARIEGRALDGKPRGWAGLSVRRGDGSGASLEATDPSGSPERKLSDAQLAAKFHDCARHAVKPIAPEVVRQVLCWCMRPEGMGNTAVLTQALA
jgi:2-methylcitrate dehydratase PrpD